MIQAKVKKRAMKSSKTGKIQISKSIKSMKKNKLKKGVEKPSGTKRNLTSKNKKTMTTTQQKKETTTSANKKDNTLCANISLMYSMATENNVLQFLVDPRRNGTLKSPGATSEFERLALQVPNVFKILFRKGNYIILWNSEIPSSRKELVTIWGNVKTYLQELLNVYIDPLDCMKIFPLQKNLTVPETESTPISELLPVKQIYMPYADSDVEKARYEEFDKANTTLYHIAVQIVEKCLEYGIDLVASRTEFMQRCNECRSLGYISGFCLFRLMCSLNTNYDTKELHYTFIDAAKEHSGSRDMKMFFWAYKNIYFPKIEEQILLEKEHSLHVM